MMRRQHKKAEEHLFLFARLRLFIIIPQSSAKVKHKCTAKVEKIRAEKAAMIVYKIVYTGKAVHKVVWADGTFPWREKKKRDK